MPVPTRPRSPSPSPQHKKLKFTPVALYGILPLGNYLGRPSLPCSLGTLRRLPDELILYLFSLFSPSDLLSLSAVSKACFAFALHEPLWKEHYVSLSEGKLGRWQGTWRKTFLTRLGHAPDLPIWPTDGISCRGIFSDVLYQPQLCASLPLHHYFPSKKQNIPRRPYTSLSPAEFAAHYAAPGEPVILTGALETWAAYTHPSHKWSLSSLANRFPSVRLQAEALSCTFAEYERYASNCAGEDTPLYMFDSGFVESASGMGEEYKPFEVFGEDLFDLFGSERPDYRWLIAGPAHSGSTFHLDPNSTSAWNASLKGTKAWVFFPPQCTPPGVYVSPDEGEVTGPVGVGEWVEAYLKEGWRRFGPQGREGAGLMRIGLQREGDVVYVPSGWWHLVVNLTPCIAVTQNFVSQHELHKVLKFMRDKPGQVSGFKDPKRRDECCEGEEDESGDAYRAGLYGRFVNLLEENEPGLLREALAKLGPVPVGREGEGEGSKVRERKERVVQKEKEKEQGSFRFDFELDFELEEEEVGYQ
ncbi:Clavaminate synthase-like protein [Dacryopinax primogenitus]|uniref:Clavaminate synthase-like protein n=1 Tax=Dacryopinax primogenitus (strain DJM 731) TaxID=1858805 RepID=M5G8K0_DACPD|nr:Clavaminate synthase-like protein [Dacryopinax primogenitus]EJU00093.1 Clavaminate synthase-like protein [Dacryopinax primogenitus]